MIKNTEKIYNETKKIDDNYNEAIERGTEQKEFEKLTSDRWTALEKKWIPLETHQANLDKILKRLKKESTHCTNWIDRIFEEEQEAK